jgi:hypothetical protein
MLQTTRSAYRYEHFELRHMLADVRFAPDSPKAGERLRHLDLQTVDGEDLGLGDLDRPHLFVFGSNTCPMTASAGEPLERLHERFGHAVGFVLVQVREAHPGEHVPQPSTLDEKRAHARRLRDSLGVSFTVAVDDLAGSFHTSLDPKPNAAYLVDSDGVIVFRSLWASDENGLRAALEAVSADTRPTRPQSTRKMGPMLGSLGHVERVVGEAGPHAVRDLARSVPPMLMAGRLAGLFGHLPPGRRGRALVWTVGAVTAGLVAVVRSAGSRVPSPAAAEPDLHAPRALHGVR